MFKFTDLNSLTNQDLEAKTVYRFVGDPEGQVRVLDEPFTKERNKQLRISAAKGKYKIESILSKWFVK